MVYISAYKCLQGVLEHPSGVCTGQTKQNKHSVWLVKPRFWPRRNEKIICEFPEKGTENRYDISMIKNYKTSSLCHKNKVVIVFHVHMEPLKY